MNEHNRKLDYSSALTHPDEILNDPSMTNAEKRVMLASWASDARAPTDLPALRKLDNGVVIRLTDVLRALRKLDDDDDPPPSPAAAAIPVRHSTVMDAAA